jgi:DHA3 family macrolide efflux protein-like MFS transporter
MKDTQPTTRSLTPFFVIWTGQAVSLIGSQVVQFALVWWLTQLTGSATVLATATLAMMLPQVLIGPIAGAYVDRWNRRMVMIVADGLVALAAVWLCYQYWLGTAQVWNVYVIMLLRAVGGCFQWPAMQASTSLMVPKEHLTRVAGLNQTMQGALSIIGPPLGALLLALLPMYGIMLVDVSTALLAIVPLLFVAVPQPAPNGHASAQAAPKQSIWGDVRDGLRYVWNWPGLMLVLVLAMVINFILNPAFSLLPLLVTRHFGGGALQLGWLESTWGVGVVVGGLLLGVWGGFKRRMVTALTGLTFMGMGTLLLGLVPADHFWLAVVSMAVAGLMNPICNGPIFAMLQAVVAPDMQGRVFTLVGSAAAAISPLSLAVAGPVADAVGIRIWYVVGGLLCVGIGLCGYFVPVVVNADQHQPAPAAASGEPLSVAVP